MASQNPPPKGVAYTYTVGLPSKADTAIFQTSVTLAAGDVTVRKDGGSFANVTNLPAEIGTTGVIEGTLTATEMDADRVRVLFHDVAGAQWCDLLLIIDTDAVLTAIADVPTVAEFEARTLAAASYATASALAVVDGIVDDILVDTGTTLPAAIAGITAPSAAAIADAVWDEATAGHAAAGSTGAALSAAGSAGDPWSVELPAAYTGDQAGALFTDLWANMVGEGEADDPTNPTTVTYKNPAGDVQVTHTLTATTRTPS